MHKSSHIDFHALNQKPTMPHRCRSIVSIGAGGIVRDAHLPAYQQAGLEVASIFDLNHERANALTAEFECVKRSARSLADSIEAAPSDAVFDIAIPASVVAETLEQLPDDSAVLIQKPLGENIQQAKQIRDICKRKNLLAAVNFQLRYAPYIMAARDLISRGAIGELHDIEVRVNVYTPWHLWTFLESIPRVEIVYHSVHYIDLVRSFMGEPNRVMARTLRHPLAPELSSSRSNLFLDYGDMSRATIHTNHGHIYGQDQQASYIKWEGTQGAIKATMGLLMNYPQGMPDELIYCGIVDGQETGWHPIPLQGSWFPDAFLGPMATLMRYANMESDVLPTSIDDAYKTMQVVEAAYECNDHGGVRLALEKSNA